MTTLEILKKAKALELSSAPLTPERKNTAIMLCADALCENATEILAANAKDVENARGKISEVMIDRLRLDETRIAAMAWLGLPGRGLIPGAKARRGGAAPASAPAACAAAVGGPAPPARGRPSSPR